MCKAAKISPDKTTRTEQSTSRITPPKVEVSMPHATQTIFDSPYKARQSAKRREGDVTISEQIAHDDLGKVPSQS